MSINTTVFDFETGGVENGCLILTMSAARFNRFNFKPETFNIDDEFIESNSFNVALSIPEQILKGRAIEQSCIKNFWLKQPKEAVDAAFFSPSKPVKESLEEFFEFVGDTQLYCRGTDFDPPKLASLCKDFGVKMPQKYNQFRDVRTYIDAFTGGSMGYIEDFVTPEWIVPHRSLDDCWRDVLQMLKAPLRYQQF